MPEPVVPGHPLVVIIGAPGAGKTRVGKRIGRLLAVPFIDTDRRIVKVHGAIADIFSEHGESYFRGLERSEVARAIQERAVLSLGGGAVLNPATQRDLASLPVVLMTVSAEAVAARIGEKRPLLKDAGIDAWQKLVDDRREIYERLASRSWDTSVRPIDQIATEIAHWVREQNPSLALQLPHPSPLDHSGVTQ
ncbi:MAG: shikimate kinase [Microbacteriaceae bacterium]|nr:shikimate kinase [Microbacteriaceae bacterium]